MDLEQAIYNSMKGLEKITTKTNMTIMIPQSLLSQRSLGQLTKSYQQHLSQLKQQNQLNPAMLLQNLNIQEESTQTSNPLWEEALKSQTCEELIPLQMDRQQLNIEIQLNQHSTQPSKLLPVKNLVIDLSEQWEYYNCVIARIVLSRYIQFTKITAIPQFVFDFMKKEISNGTI